jgi:hypothetical protein
VELPLVFDTKAKSPKAFAHDTKYNELFTFENHGIIVVWFVESPRNKSSTP